MRGSNRRPAVRPLGCVSDHPWLGDDKKDRLTYEIFIVMIDTENPVESHEVI